MKIKDPVVLRERKTLTLDNFRGVDLTSEPTRVSLSRSPDAVNFIPKNGIPHKRPGFREIAGIDGECINGIFPYDNGNDSLILIHAGRRFFTMSNSASGYSVPQEVTYADNIIEGMIYDSKSQAFLFGNRLYIIGCGDYLVFERIGNSNVLSRVFKKSDTYIPTTTKAIDDDSVSEKQLYFCEPVNILSPFIRNTLCGSGSPDGATWTLDAGKISSGSTVSLSMQILETVNGVEEVNEYELKSGNTNKNSLYFVKKNACPYGGLDTGGGLCGSIDRARGRITLTFPTEMPTPSPNIAVIYDPGFEDRSSRIFGCSFGTVYGGALFLSGNPLFANVDFRSGKNDPTYFPDTGYTLLSESGSAITGYSLLSSGSLAAFSKGRENRIIYREKEYQTDTDSGVTEAVYPTVTANIGEVPENPFLSAAFSGDDMIVSENGVFGILTGGYQKYDRIAYERSRSVAERLKSLDLSEAVCTVCADRFYLAVGGYVFVADRGGRYIPESFTNFCYEWWLWSDIPVHVFGKIDTLLAFGTKQGKICVFDDRHTDRSLTPLEAGDLTVTLSDSMFTVNSSAIIPGENDTVTFLTDGLFSRVADIYADGSGGQAECGPDGIPYFYFSREPTSGMSDGETALSCIYEGETVRVADGSLSFGGLSTGTEYIISDIDRGKRRCRLRYTNGDYVSSLPTQEYPTRSCKLTVSLKNKPLFITAVNGSSFRVRESADGIALDLSAASSPPESILGYIVRSRPVCAKWTTPLLDLGSNSVGKTLLSMTFYSGSTKGKVHFGYETRRTFNTGFEEKRTNSFDLSDMSFNDFTLETGFESSMTVKTNERNFNYIRFFFSSDDAEDASIGSLSVCFRYNRRHWGIN